MYIVRPVGLSLVSATVPENDAPPWQVGETYTIGNAVVRSDAVWVSSIDGNTGLDPLNEIQELEGARWIWKGPTNRMAFLDQAVSSETSGGSPLVLEALVDGSFNTIALFGLRASHTLIEILVNDQVRDSAEIMAGAAPVGNWFDWLNTEFFKFGKRFVRQGLNGLTGAVIRLTLTGDAPALGMLVAGRTVHIGETNYSRATKVKRKTFTTIKTNAFGATTATKRAIARDTQYRVTALREGFPAKERFLDQIEGERVVTFGHVDWPELINFGYVTDFELPCDLPDHFQFEIKVQGVT